MYRISEKEIFNLGKLMIKEGEGGAEHSRVCGPLDIAWRISATDGIGETIMLAGDVVGCFLRDSDECPESPDMIHFILGIPEFEHYLRKPFTGQTRNEYEEWLDSRPAKLECCECYKFFDESEMHDVESLDSCEAKDFLIARGHTEGFVCKSCFELITDHRKEECEDLSDNDKFGVDTNGKDLT